MRHLENTEDLLFDVIHGLAASVYILIPAVKDNRGTKVKKIFFTNSFKKVQLTN